MDKFHNFLKTQFKNNNNEIEDDIDKIQQNQIKKNTSFDKNEAIFKRDNYQNYKQQTEQTFYCVFHVKNRITNFCLNKECQTPLCPECIKIHTQNHVKNNEQINYETIDNIIDSVQQQLSIADELLQESSSEVKGLQRITKSQTDDVDNYLEAIRESLYNNVDIFINNYKKETYSILKQKCTIIFNFYFQNNKFYFISIFYIFLTCFCIKIIQNIYKQFIPKLYIYNIILPSLSLIYNQLLEQQNENQINSFIQLNQKLENVLQKYIQQIDQSDDKLKTITQVLKDDYVRICQDYAQDLQNFRESLQKDKVSIFFNEQMTPQLQKDLLKYLKVNNLHKKRDFNKFDPFSQDNLAESIIVNNKSNEIYKNPKQPQIQYQYTQYYNQNIAQPQVFVQPQQYQQQPHIYAQPQVPYQQQFDYKYQQQHF